MTKHLTSKFKMYNCLIISRSHVAFRDVLAVTDAWPSIFSKLFTVNKVKVCCTRLVFAFVCIIVAQRPFTMFYFLIRVNKR